MRARAPSRPEPRRAAPLERLPLLLLGPPNLSSGPSARTSPLEAVSARGRYVVGFILSFGALYAKLWRVKKIMINPSLEVIKLSNFDMIKRMGVLLVTEVAIMIAFMLSAPLHYQAPQPPPSLHTPHCPPTTPLPPNTPPPPLPLIAAPLSCQVDVDKQDEFNRTEESHGHCTTNQTGLAFLLTVVCINLLVLVYGNVLVYQARAVPTKYNEGKFIGFCVANNLQTSLITVLLAFFIYEQPVAFFVIKWMAVLVCDLGAPQHRASHSPRRSCASCRECRDRYGASS